MLRRNWNTKWIAASLLLVSMTQNGCMGCDDKDKEKKAETAAAACVDDPSTCEAVHQHMIHNGAAAADQQLGKPATDAGADTVVSDDKLQTQSAKIQAALKNMPGSQEDKDKVLRELAILEQERALKNLKPADENAKPAQESEDGAQEANSAPITQVGGETTQ